MSLDKLLGVAEAAMQSGLYTGNRVKRRASGDMAEKLFRCRDLGSAADDFPRSRVVSAGPLQVGGLQGWWTWIFIHIAFLTGYRNRLGVLLYLVAGLHPRHPPRADLYHLEQIQTLGDVYTLPLGPQQPAVTPQAAADGPSAAGQVRSGGPGR